MSSDGNLKLARIPYGAHVADVSSNTRKQGQHREPICTFCDHVISKRQHPVLLKSGESVHLDCYLQMPKRPRNRGRNSK